MASPPLLNYHLENRKYLRYFLLISTSFFLFYFTTPLFSLPKSPF